MNTKIKGDITEAMVTARALQAGYTVLKPVGDKDRYDLVFHIENQFLRVQCKTGRITNDCVKFKVCSVGYKAKKESYHGQIDLFAVYCQELDKVYLVPIQDCGITEKSLRLKPALSGREKDVSFAINYEIKTMPCKSIEADTTL